MPAQQTDIHERFKNIDSKMELLLALGEHVTTEIQLDNLLQLLADSARDVIDAETVVVPLIDFEKNEYIYRSASGKLAEEILGTSLPLTVGMCGWVLSNKKPLLFGKEQELHIHNKTVWEEGMDSVLLVPLISRGHIIGGISALGKTNQESFTQRDLELLTLFANQVSVAVENAQILEQLNSQKLQLQELLEATRFEKELAEVTLEAIADAVVVTDTAGRIVNINAATEKLTGYRAKDTIGKVIDSLIYISDWDPKLMKHPLHHALATDSMVHIATGVLTTKGRPDIKIEGSVTIMRGDNGVPIGAVLLFRDVTDARKMAEQVHHYATYDQLTGLVNRREFETRLQHAVDSAINEHKTHALCYLDLDQFKIVNDTCGHAAGDELLRQLGIILAKHIRERDTLGRIGGDEFGLLLENCTMENAVKIAESLREDIEDFRFTASNKTFRIGASIGLVQINDSASSINALLAAADQACYAAKELGRNRVKVFTESDEQLVSRSNEMHWVSRLHDALSQNHFVLYCQPIVNTGFDDPKGKFSYYELLVRLRDKDNSILPPGAFLPAAERYGLITAIDRWIISQYFKWLHENPSHTQQLERCSINLSGQSLGDEGLLAFIREQLDIYSIPAEKLCFEITETAAIANLSDALGFIEEMRSLGVTFALDDFGTGMSSFSYLKQLPIDILKIDGSFIKDVLTDKIDASLVKTIVEISKTMGKKTIAEYVESMEVYEFVKQAGVDFAQGYGVCRPLPINYLL